MFVNSQNFDDVKKYFQHTYVKFKETGDHIWHIDTVSSNEILCTDKSKEQVGIDLTIGYNLEYILPRKAVFQFGRKAIMLSRIPARQWKKGMCKANTAFHTLSADGSWLSYGFEIDLIEGFVNKPSYYPVEQALKDFQNDLVSVALTPRISMSKNGKIYIDSVLVARYTEEDQKITCRKIFAPEISKVFSGFAISTL